MLVQCPYIHPRVEIVLSQSARAYLSLPADVRFETRMPTLLKRHAERVAMSKGESLSQYVVQVLAERVAEDFAMTIEWQLTVPEQLALLRVLSAPAAPSSALDAARQRVQDQFEIEMPDDE